MIDKRKKKKIVLIVLIFLLIILFGLISYYFFIYKSDKNNSTTHGQPGVSLQNPMKSIIERNIDSKGNIDEKAIIKEGIINFNETYIVYLMAAIGISKLHKSSMGYGDPKLELVMEDETWNVKISNGLIIGKGKSDGPDIRIIMKKEEAVRALLSSDIKSYMKETVTKGKTQIEMVSGKLELLSKGYLDLYKELTGEMPKF